MNTTTQGQAAPPVLTVSQLNRQVRSLLEGHFDFIWVGGEISNFARPSSGHWYFTLKDGDAQVRCAMFRNRNQRLRFSPGQGDEVRLRCRVSLYEGRGEFQLIVEHMEPAGAGALQAAFDRLKAQLQAEGLFDPGRKQGLPEVVERIGVITSPTGAAIHDILTVLRRRWPAIEVALLPVAVQGEGAAPQVAAAIDSANRWCEAGHIELDALIIGRGGGSMEDLWAFNEEVVARAVAASTLPVVSAVGHEVDFTIADFVADVRAPTPSAAAELLSPDRAEWQTELAALAHEMADLATRRIHDGYTTLEHLQKRMRHPGSRLREQAQRLDDMEQRLLRAQRNLLADHRSRLRLLNSRTLAASPLSQIRVWKEENRLHRQRMNSALSQQTERCRAQLSRMQQVLNTLNPLSVLGRGYAIVTDSKGTILTNPNSVGVGEDVEAQLAHGRLGLKVKRVEPKD